MVWHDDVGISYEADSKHAEAIIRETGAENMSSVKTPMMREDGSETNKSKEQDIRERKRFGTLGKKADVEG